MNIPITKRVMMGGSKKACGCCGACQCGKTPAKKALKGDQDQLPVELQNAIKAAPGKMYNSPAKQGAYPKNLRKKVRAASTGDERRAIADDYLDSVYTKRVNDGEKLSRMRQGTWKKIKERKAARTSKQSPNKMWGAAKVAHGKKKSPAKMGCGSKRK